MYLSEREDIFFPPSVSMGIRRLQSHRSLRVAAINLPPWLGDCGKCSFPTVICFDVLFISKGVIHSRCTHIDQPRTFYLSHIFGFYSKFIFIKQVQVEKKSLWQGKRQRHQKLIFYSSKSNMIMYQKCILLKFTTLTTVDQWITNSKHLYFTL